ncbi:MAG: glyoxalase [Kaistia sp. SCN 65-12]|nr:MAG: glyoxalase [Kaistia sp. SCN 65-12]
MQITLTSILVDDQAKALAFYTDALGFELKHDFPIGGARWLTVVSPATPEGTELLLEPMGFEPARVYQRALFTTGIPAAAFAVDDIDGEHTRLSAKGVRFRSPPYRPASGPAIAVFEDGCGNLIQIFETPQQEQAA